MKHIAIPLSITVLCAAISAPPANKKRLSVDISPDAVSSLIANAPKSHPRLMANDETFAQLRRRIETEALPRLIADHVVREAEALIDVTPVERVLQGRRLLDKSRRCLKRTLVLAMAHRLTDREEFLQRCRKEMMAASAFSDWNPSHFLDVGEMTLALAIGYDWLFDDLDAECRQTVRQAIIEKGLRTSQKHGGWWVRASNNWGQVCHAGVTAGALAVYEDEPELATQIVHRAATNVTHSMAAFAPNGSYPEGPGYWDYGTSFNVVLIALMESVLGTDFGLCDAPGFDQTGQYTNLVTGPSGRFFNYADGGDGRPPLTVLHWFAGRFDRPDWAMFEEAKLRDTFTSWQAGHAATSRNRLLPLGLLWLDGTELPTETAMPLHWNSGGKVPITVHRSSWDDANATYIGLKAGSPSANHGQMDTGSFVLDADGVRWAWDLGAEGYHGIESRGMNLWSSAQNSDRWKIFRQSNKGHNTLVIDGQLQVAKAFAPIVRFSADSAFPHSVADLSNVYAGQAKTVHRGVALLPSHEVLIHDRLTGVKPGATVRWGMITRAAIETNEGPRLVLKSGEARLALHLLGSADVAWRSHDTAKPAAEWDSPNPGTQMVMLEVTAPADGPIDIAVLATPGSCTDSVRESIKLRPPLEWE